MRLKRLLLLIPLLWVPFSAPAPAQNVAIGQPIRVRQLPACTYQRTGLAFHVYDGASAADCTTGGGTVPVLCSCNGSGTWASFINSSATGISYAGDILIAASGTTKDVTVTATDDIILTPVDALTVAPGGNATLTTTAGNVTLTAGGTTQDASLVSTDDIFLTPDDALVAVAGGNTTITSTAGTVAIASSAGPITVTAVGGSNDITMTAADDVILSPTGDLTAVAGAAVTVTATVGTAALRASAGAVTVTAVGATNDVTLTAADDVILAATDDTTVAGDNLGINTTTVTINPGGSAVELQMSAGVSTFLGSLILPISSAPPIACAAGSKGTVYYDSDTNLVCVCNATGYVQIADGTSACS